MRIRILGCSGGIGAGSRTSAMLVDDDVLLDAGTGIGDLALDDLYEIRHVFLTHAHLDHIAGLPMLVDSNFEEDFVTPVTVYARSETLQAIRMHLFNDVIWPDFSRLPSEDRAMLQFVEFNPGQTVALADRKYHAVDVRHSVPSLGFTVQNSNGTLAISGDTKTNETLWPVLNACDDLKVLIIEVSFPNELEALATAAGHYCPRTMCRDLTRLVRAPDVWLTGMKPGEEERILRQVIAAAPNNNIRMLSRGTDITV
jgi:ribonuclease BN (tRNA processing enzyme)